METCGGSQSGSARVVLRARRGGRESGGEGDELRRGCAPLLLGRRGSEGVRWRPMVAASMPAISALNEKGGGVVGRGGDLVGEAG
jgi:hypothetical protein